MKLQSRTRKNGFWNRIVLSTKEFALLAIIFFLFQIILSAIEIGLGSLNHSLESGFLNLWGYSCLEDLKLFFRWLLPAYLVFLPLHILLPKITKVFYKALFILFFLIQILLVFYYNTTLLMLGSDLFGYSLEEITQTVGASGSFSLLPVMVILLTLGLLITTLWILPRKIILNTFLAFSLPMISMVFVMAGYPEILETEALNSEFEANLVQNKSGHYYRSAYTQLNEDIYEPDIYAESYLGEYFSEFAHAEALEYIDEANYPFLRKKLKRDVLSPYFETGEKAPDMVFIIVEGLGRAFSNRGAELGNFTPFLDSLSTQSLYWPNFLSNGGRTFTVLPSLLGSLPFAKNGFMELNDNMPEQLSLFNLLQKNGYQTSFYYGGNSEFDNMQTFLASNRVNRIIDENDFPKTYKKIPASSSGFTWGYGDKELFRFYLNSRNNENSRPRLDVLLTVSMHSPFIVDEPERFNRIFEKKMNEFGFSEEKKEKYRNYKKQYSSILFTDMALKELFEEYQERPGFDNTIFVITGDHRIPEIPMASKIDRFHVPLIIYSPMLSRPAEFEAVSSHFDVAPSMVSFLKNNYSFQVPAVNAFIGRGLDTTRGFQNIHQIPLKQTKTDLVDFVMGEYHLNGDDLFRITRDFREEPFRDEAKKQELKNAFNQFRRKNSDIILGKEILPDSIIKKYTN